MFEKSPVILIVDDEPINIEIILHHLRYLDWTIITAKDGVEAWEKLAQTPSKFDIVLADIMTPKMDVIEILQRMKQHPNLKQIPVILHTARAGKAEILKGIQAGAGFYLTNPFDEKMLKSIIHAAWEKRLSYKTLQNQLKQNFATLGLMQSTQFIFRNLEESRQLSLFIASACKKPDKIVLGLSELLVNAVEHGLVGITYAEKTALIDSGRWTAEVKRRLALPENAKKYVKIVFTREGDLVRIVISDQGDGFAWQKYLNFDPERAFDNHGRGIAMAKKMSFEHIEFLGNGNEVMVEIHSPSLLFDGFDL